MSEPAPGHSRYAALVGLLDATYGATTSLVSGLAEEDFARPTRTAAWTVRELLFHQLLDAQRALIVFATPDDGPADRDAVTYWTTFNPSRGDEVDASGHARFVKVAASAYAASSDLVQHWTSTANAAVRAGRAHVGQGFVATQGHVLEVRNFVHTLVVEAVVHHLDLTLEVPSPGFRTEGYDAVRAVLTGLLGAELPTQWTETEAVLKGTGRVHLTDVDRRRLGELARRIPLLG